MLCSTDDGLATLALTHKKKKQNAEARKRTGLDAPFDVCFYNGKYFPGE